MSWQIAANIREMFVELVAINEKQIYFSRALNRKDQLISGFNEALSFLPPDLDRAQSEVYVASDLERVAVRERWFNPAAFLVTEGFENLSVLGDQTRKELFSLNPVSKSNPLIASELCFGVAESTDSRGGVEISLDAKEVDFVASKLKLSDTAVVAVCFLHSDKNPLHEKQITQQLAKHEITVVASHLFFGDERARAEKAMVKALTLKGQETLALDIEKLGFGKTRVHIGDEVYKKNHPKLSLTLLEDRFIVSYQGVQKELKISGLTKISLDDGGLAHVGPEEIGSEPGPSSFGKGLTLCLLDLLVLSRGLNFTDLARLKIDSNRASRLLVPVAKQLQLSLESTSQKFLNLAYELIVLELKTFASLFNLDVTKNELNAGGLLAPIMAPQIANRLNAQKLNLSKESQWERALQILENSYADFSQASQRGSVCYDT